MAYDIKISQKLSTSLMMTPQLQQAIKLLQLSRLELEEYVTQQLEENPTLEEGTYESNEERIETERAKETSAEQIMSDRLETASNIVDKVAGEDHSPDVDWEAFSRMQESAPPQSSTVRRSLSGDDDNPNYENTVSRTKTMQEHLMGQIGELDLSQDEQKLAQLIIGNIDDRGYLRVSVEELIESEGVDREQFEDILDSIQRLDPPGVGARDLKECLLIQLRQQRLKNGVVEKIIENHLHELETRNFNAIAKALKISLDEVIQNVQIVAELEPVPGRQFGGDNTQYIVPDVYVFKVGSEWRVAMNDDGLPKLKVSKLYKDMATGNEARGQDKEYIKDKVKSAVWLIKSIQERQRTIFRVAECIVKRQMDFFELGVEHLKPMILKDIAEDIEMHESTISRVTSNKYIHTPRGIFELKYFFNSAVSRTDGDSLASESVKSMISDIVRAEDQKRPISDQQIADMLEEKGIQLARRTVAKYREQLNILPSSKRKKYF
jgi:RNA polymerase sigma-54 factor